MAKSSATTIYPVTTCHTLSFSYLSLGDSNHIDDFIAVKDLLDVDGLLKVLSSPLHLVGHTAAVHLDLHNVGTLLVKALEHAKLWGRKKNKTHYHSIRLLCDVCTADTALGQVHTVGRVLIVSIY